MWVTVKTTDVSIQWGVLERLGFKPKQIEKLITLRYKLDNKNK